MKTIIGHVARIIAEPGDDFAQGVAARTVRVQSPNLLGSRYRHVEPTVIRIDRHSGRAVGLPHPRDLLSGVDVEHLHVAVASSAEVADKQPMARAIHSDVRHTERSVDGEAVWEQGPRCPIDHPDLEVPWVNHIDPMVHGIRRDHPWGEAERDRRRGGGCP